MNAAQWAIGYVSTALNVALLSVLIWRRHATVMPVFTLYIGWIATYHVLIVTAPNQFYTQEFWLLHKVAEATLRFGIAFELAYRVFRGFPGAAASAMNAMLVVAAIAAFATTSIYSPGATYEGILGVVVPRIAQSTAWMLTALSMLVLWYRIPLGSLQRAVLMGLTPYLLVFSAGMALLHSQGWEFRSQIGYLTSISFVIVVSYWTVVAWKTRPVDVFSGVVGRPPSSDRTMA